MAHRLAQVSDALQGRYAIERELGRGGMATVYLAQDLKLHRRVALKVLRPELAASLGNERFLREIEIAARLNHPHILSLHDSGEVGGQLYYAMPYVEGESLRQRLDREKQLPLNDVLQIAQQVADALSYAHSLGIVHRDIKPENILLSGEHAVVADFGIARAIDAAGGSRLTETGLAIGTPAYMSPEQATGEAVDGRSDVYALGCVVYEMLVGEPPYTGPTAAAIIARRLSEPLPSLRVVRDGVPLAVEQAVHKALARSAADRFRTAAQFAQALTAPTAPARSRRALGSRTPLIAGATGLVLAGAFLLPGALRRFRATVDPAANVIAVLPLLPTSPDTALERLGQDLVVTLSSNLEGLEGMHVIDPLTVLAQAKGRPAGYSTLSSAVEFGRRFGASGVIRGALTRDGTRVRLYLALYATADSAMIAQTSVLGSPDSLAAVTDSATWSLLQQIWRTRDPPTPSLAAVTTRSIPALRAFLAGEQAITENRWEDAEKDYATAIREDSTFWLAYWRHSMAKGWRWDEEPDSAALSVALAHLPELPEKERLLAEVWAQDTGNQPIRDAEFNPSGLTLGAASLEHWLNRARAVTERFPDYWPGWLEYADQLYHIGPLVGHDLREARAAFQRVLQLNPRLIPAWDHLNGVALFLQDTVLLKRIMARLDSLKPGSLPMGVRMAAHILTGGSFSGPLADSMVRRALSFENILMQGYSATALGGTAAQTELSRRVLARSPAPTLAAFHRKGIALDWAARGAWDSALAAMDAYAERASDLAGVTSDYNIAIWAAPDLVKLDPYRIAVVAAWLGALDPALAVGRRGTAVRAVARLDSPRWEAELYWLDGLLAASQRDLLGLREARRQLTKVEDGDSRWSQRTVRSLVAFELELLGRRREAAESMAALSWDLEKWVGPYHFGINRLAAARWLTAEGDPDQAARLLPWHQAIIPNFIFMDGAVVLESLSYLEMARVETTRGNRSLAREYYQRFLRRYDLPSPRMRHLVDEARAALMRLE
jgi:tRNA A-37 threonylcarbamoyl transferase component Bud32/TolB-like protein